MREHHALGHAGGARGEEHRRGVAAAALGDLGVDKAGSRAALASISSSFRSSRAAAACNGACRAGRRSRCASSVGHCGRISSSLSTCSWSSAIAKRISAFWIGNTISVGDRVLVERHRDAAEALRRAHRGVDARPVVADQRQVLAALEALPPRGRRRARAPRRRSCRQVQVCQMPRSFSRIAGRPPRSLRVVHEQLRKRVQRPDRHRALLLLSRRILA